MNATEQTDGMATDRNCRDRDGLFGRADRAGMDFSGRDQVISIEFEAMVRNVIWYLRTRNARS